MEFTFAHTNFNVKDLNASLAFYHKALGLIEQRRREASDGSFTLVFLTDGKTPYVLELTCLRGHPQAYDLGENEIHLALRVDNFEAALALHKEIGCVCYENEGMGIYFIEDPDGYWIEILP